VDCNLSEDQRLTSEAGISDALARGLTLDKVVVRRAERVYAIPPGSAGGLQLLTGSRILPQFAALRKRFDFIFVEAPPISKGAPALTVASACDASVLILESNTTRRDVTLKAKESLVRAGCNLVGVVLNGRTFPIPENIYKRL
jgi:Mrp family chromosome partitioning ATPase